MDKFYYSRLERLRATGDVRRFHAAVRQRKNGKYIVDKIERLVEEDGVAHHSDREILDIMTKYVAELYAGDGPVDDYDFIFNEEFPSYDPCCDAEITAYDVNQALSQTTPRKAVGLDSIYAEMFISATQDEEECFAAAFDYILGDNYPTEWETDRKKPIPKNGSAPSTNSYRMIGIQCTPRKLCNTVLRNRLEKIIEFDPWQSGFCAGRRTSDNVYVLTEVLKFHISRKNRKSMPRGFYVAIFEFSKAFDRVHIPTLINNCERNVSGANYSPQSNPCTRIPRPVWK